MARAKKRNDGYLRKTFTVNGKRYYVYARTQTELFEKEQKKRQEIEQGFEQHDNPTVSQYYERWTAGRQNSVKEATLRTQAKIFNILAAVNIPSQLRTFGEMKIKDVTIDDLRILQKELSKSRKAQSVNDYMAHLKHFFKDATNERVLDYNPCVLLNTLKITEEKARDGIHRALTIEEQTTFFNAEITKQSLYYNVFRLAILTGLRIGEIGALKNSDIKGGFIHVQRTITRLESGMYCIGETAKTKAGKRTVPVSPQIQEVITNQREVCRLIDGNTLSIDNTLFKASEGGILLATPCDREIKRICNKIGLKPFTMHAFRATFATRCVEAGMNPKTLQEILGHANIGVTMNLYAHVMDDTKKQEMQLVNIAI